LLRFTDGIAAALIWPSLVGLFADCTEEKDRATAMSIFSTSILVGLGIGPSVGSYIRGLTGSFHDVFFFVSGVMATGFVAVLISRPYLKKYFERSGLPDKRMRAHQQHAFYPFSREIWSKKFIVLVMLAFLQMGATSMLTPIAVLYGRIDLNLSMVMIGHMFLGAAVIVGMLAIPAGRLVDRIGKEKSLKLGFAFGVAGMCIAVTEKRMELLLIGIMLYGVGFVIGAPAWLSLVTHGRWSQYRGSILGIITAFQGIGVIVGPVVGTYVWDHIGHTEPFLLCGVFLAVCLVASLVWLREGG
jgi:MFS family permease